MEVAGNPTTTTPIFLRSISRDNALRGENGKKTVGICWRYHGTLRNLRYLGGIVDEDWHDRGVLIAVHDKPHLIQPLAKVPAVVKQLINPLLPYKKRSGVIRALQCLGAGGSTPLRPGREKVWGGVQREVPPTQGEGREVEKELSHLTE